MICTLFIIKSLNKINFNYIILLVCLNYKHNIDYIKPLTNESRHAKNVYVLI